jgi:hypothetical protein
MAGPVIVDPESRPSDISDVIEFVEICQLLVN